MSTSGSFGRWIQKFSFVALAVAAASCGTEADPFESGCPTGGVSFPSGVTYAATAVASSEYPNLTAMEATGAPNCFDSQGCLLTASGSGDCARSWTFATSGSASEQLTVTFPKQSNPPKQVLIYETYKPDGVSGLIVTYDNGTSETIVLAPKKETTSYKLLNVPLANAAGGSVATIVISLNQSTVSDWTYIDAVGVR